MADLEDQLRSTITRRIQAVPLSVDLPDRIHARVRDRRRRRVVAGAVVTTVVLLVGVGALGVLAVRPSGPGQDLAEAPRPSPTAPPPPAGSDTTPATSPSTSPSTAGPPPSQPAERPPPTGEPPASTAATATTAATTGSTTTATTTPELKPPDSSAPSVRACDRATQPVVEVAVNAGLPAPRCARVTADQRLQLRNATGEQVVVSIGRFQVTLAPGATALLGPAFGDYLQPGVHRVDVSLYGSTDPEIWLVT